MNLEVCSAFILSFFLARCLAISEEYDDTSSHISTVTNAPTALAPVNTSIITAILDRLTDEKIYDKRLRPLYGGNCIDVGITIHVSSISAVSEVNMDFTLDFYLRQSWQDSRLAFVNAREILDEERFPYLQVGVDYLQRLWKPDTFFPNEKKASFHTATTHNSFLRIYQTGYVLTSQRLTVTATCPMNLKLFPMDTQKCQLEIESYGYTTKDTAYQFGDLQDPNKSAVAFDENISLPQFELTYYKVNYKKAVTTSGTYVRLSFEVVLTRNLGFYLMNIIVPSILIVTISWVSFWLNREASPARVGLGVTTVLTMTTLITTTNNTMPKVSYIKGLDYFLNFCFVMVFASLVEYAVVSYLNKKMAQQREKRRKMGEQQAPVEMPVFYNHAALKANMVCATPSRSSYNSQKPRHDRFNGPRSPLVNSIEIPPECECRTIPLIQHPRMVTSVGMWPAPFGKPKRPPGTCRACTPAKIDKYSRYFFPIIFISFNVIYWAVMWYYSWQVELHGYQKISDDRTNSSAEIKCKNNSTDMFITTQGPFLSTASFDLF